MAVGGEKICTAVLGLVTDFQSSRVLGLAGVVGADELKNKTFLVKMRSEREQRPPGMVVIRVYEEVRVAIIGYSRLL